MGGGESVRFHFKAALTHPRSQSFRDARGIPRAAAAPLCMCRAPSLRRGAKRREEGAVLTVRAVLALGAADLPVGLDAEEEVVVGVELPPVLVSAEVVVAPHVPPGAGGGRGGGGRGGRVGGPGQRHVPAGLTAGQSQRGHPEEEHHEAAAAAGGQGGRGGGGGSGGQVGEGGGGGGTLCQSPFAHCPEALGAAECLMKRNMLDG